MVKASKGFRVKTRHTLRVRPRERGLQKVTNSLRVFEPGQKASVVIDARLQKGMPHPRYQGKTGTVMGRQGGSYQLEIIEGAKRKVLVVSPEHLRRA